MQIPSSPKSTSLKRTANSAGLENPDSKKAKYEETKTSNFFIENQKRHHIEAIKYLDDLVDFSPGDIEDFPKIFNLVDKEGHTPLHFAAACGHRKIVEAILHEASLQYFSLNFCPEIFNLVDKKGRTPLHLAARHGHLDIVKALTVPFDALPDSYGITDNEGCTPLHLAARHGHEEIVKELLSNAIIKVGITKMNSNFDVLMNAETKVDIPDKNGFTPLHYATYEGNLDIVKTLISAKANVDIPDFENRTPLHYAVQKGNLDIVKALISAKANVYSPDFENRTPLYYAAYKGNRDILKALITAAEELSRQDRTPRLI